MTRRQFRAWLAWLDMQWDETDKVCDYLRQVSFDIRRTHVKDPKSVRWEDTRIAYKRRSTGEAALTDEEKQQRMRNSRAAWGAFLGVGAKKAKRKE